jgi:4-hydroxy 2-oxovalerate aldolase
MVDSFGSVSPVDVTEMIRIVKERVKCSVGFHGHNNLELGLSNTLAAIDNGVDYVDATILGMGRGAGNLKMELLLTYLNRHYNLNVDLNVLGDIISLFSDLLQKYKWGTNLPYMISGAFSLPQKEIMEWTNNRLYSFNSIVRALDNKKANMDDNAKYPILTADSFDVVIIVGGGANAVSHLDGVKALIRKYKSIALIHATARHAVYYQDIDVPQFYCLVGSEGKRLTRVFSDLQFKGTCVILPYPRKMGTDVPDFVKNSTFELPYIEFSEDYSDSCTAVALQIAALYCKKDFFLIGYDGYAGGMLSEKDRTSLKENDSLFLSFKKYYNKTLISLASSLYIELDKISVYQLVC